MPRALVPHLVDRPPLRDAEARGQPISPRGPPLPPSALSLSLAALRREAQRWVELYEWHDKYPLVGRLRSEEAADPEEQEMALFHALEAEGSGNYKPFKRQ